MVAARRGPHSSAAAGQRAVVDLGVAVLVAVALAESAVVAEVVLVVAVLAVASSAEAVQRKGEVPMARRCACSTAARLSPTRTLAPISSSAWRRRPKFSLRAG